MKLNYYLYLTTISEEWLIGEVSAWGSDISFSFLVLFALWCSYCFVSLQQNFTMSLSLGSNVMTNVACQLDCIWKQLKAKWLNMAMRDFSHFNSGQPLRWQAPQEDRDTIHASACWFSLSLAISLSLLLRHSFGGIRTNFYRIPM